MGLQSSSCAFSLALSFVLGDYRKLGYKMKCYIDDISIYSQDVASHLKTLEYILERFSAHNLLVSFTKSKFLACSVNFLGYKLGEDSIEPQNDKVKVIESLQPSKTHHDVQCLLGKLGFLSRFIPNFAQIVSPIRKLLRGQLPVDSQKQNPRKVVDWNTECDVALTKAKKVIIDKAHLKYPIFDEACPFVLYTDASLNGIGYSLFQIDWDKRLRPVYHSGRSLRETEKNYPILILEGVAIACGLIQFEPHLSTGY